VRRVDARWIGALIAFTVGLLALLAIDAALEGLEIAAEAPSAFGGSALVFAGALVAYLALAGVDSYLSGRRDRAGGNSVQGGLYMALLVSIGIGLHNLGEGLAIGSSYATGALALGAFLVVGFAVHNTTEGLAIVAPLRGGAGTRSRVRIAHLVAFGLIAGAPAILGAWIGAAAFNPSLAALLFGVGVGAIARVIVQISPAMRDGEGRILHPLSVAGMFAGIAVLYLTGLLVSV
jgi:zinc transporter ZupT